MSDISNLRDTVIPKSDQLNADQLLDNPITITVTNVRRGEADQPITIGYHGDNGRPYKPCKTMRKVIIFAWGEDGNLWIGRSMTLYCDANIMFGGIKVGGIRISHMSDIKQDLSVSLTATKGKKALYVIKQLKSAESPEARTKKMIEAFAKISVTKEQIATYLQHDIDVLTVAELTALSNIYTDITKEGKLTTGYFPELSSHEPLI